MPSGGSYATARCFSMNSAGGGGGEFNLEMPFIKLLQCTQIHSGAYAVIKVRSDSHHPTSGRV